MRWPAPPKASKTHQPIMLIEALKVDADKLRAWLENLNYFAVMTGINLLAIHKTDPGLAQIKFVEPAAASEHDPKKPALGTWSEGGSRFFEKIMLR